MPKKIIHSDNDEMLLCFDEQGNIITPQPRRVAHNKPYSIWHAIVNIWVLNSRAEILCTHRAPHVSDNPGKWQTYIGGHVRADSTFSETVMRELFEEIGLKVGKDNLKLIDRGRREDNMHVYENYAFVYNGDLSKLNFSDSEVGEARWVSFEEYQRSKTENPDGWCNGMKPEQYKKVCEVLGF